MQVALLSEMATVEFDEDTTTTEAIASGIGALGFDVECVGVSSNTECSRIDFKVLHRIQLLCSGWAPYLHGSIYAS